MIKKLILLFVSLFAFVACEENVEPTEAYDFAFAEGTATSVVVAGSGGSSAIEFTAPDSWSAQALDLSTGEVAQWITLSSQSGLSGEAAIEAVFTANDLVAERTGKVEIACENKSISILYTQSSSEGIAVTVVTTEIEAPADYDYTAALTFDFSAKGDWTLTIEDEDGENPQWLTIEKYSGEAGDYSLELLLLDNQTTATRSATITVECNGDSASGVINQLGVDEVVLTMSVDSCSGGTIKMDIDAGSYDGNYYVVVCGADNFDTYTWESAEYLQALIEYYVEAGRDMSVVNGYSVFSGAQVVDLSVGYYIEPETRYYVMAAAYNTDSYTVVSNAPKVEVTTPVLEYVTDLSFEFSATDIWLDYATITAKPSRDGVNYFMGVAFVDYLVFGEDDSYYEDAESFMADMIYYAGVYKDYYVHDTEYTYKATGLSGDNEFCIFTFAVDGNMPVSELYSGSFWTYDGMASNGDVIDVEQSYMTEQEVYLNMDPYDYTGVYYLGAYPTDSYDGDAERMARIFVEYEQEYGGVTDFTKVDNINFYKGVKEDAGLLVAWPGLQPNTKYTVFVFGVNADTTVPTEVSTIEVTVGSRSSSVAPYSSSPAQDKMESLIRYAESSYSGEALISDYVKGSSLGEVQIPMATFTLAK